MKEGVADTIRVTFIILLRANVNTFKYLKKSDSSNMYNLL